MKKSDMWESLMEILNKQQEIITEMSTKITEFISDKEEKEKENKTQRASREEVFCRKMEKIDQDNEKFYAEVLEQKEKIFLELGEVKKLLSFAEESISNVLLAIRQNTCYHAWYPAQMGQEEQYVVGVYQRPEDKQQQLET